MIIVREINLEAARHHSPEAFMQVTVETREEARAAARRLLPMYMGKQAVIYIHEENLVVHIGSLENERHIRCWTPIADGEALILPQGEIRYSTGALRLGYPRSQGEAPFLFPNGREKEVKGNEDTEVKGEK